MSKQTTEQRRANYLATVSPMYRGIVERAFAGDGGRMNAIKGKCLDCCNFDRAEVAACTVAICPLHSFRPKYGGDAGEDGAIPGQNDPDTGDSSN
jgi:hypothetical protein